MGLKLLCLLLVALRKLRSSSVHRFVWTRRQPLASIGAVLSLLDGPTGCDPAFCVVWFRFRLLRRYLPLWLLVMVLSIFSLQVLLRLVFGGILMLWLGRGLVCLCSATWLAPFSILRLLSLMLGVIRLQLTFVVDRVFVVGLCWIFMAPCSSLILLMSGKEIRLCFGVSWLGVFGMGFSLVGSGVKCGHGLTSRPRENASEPFLNELLRLFDYPPGSGRALLAGTLHLRYCAARFDYQTTAWRFPVPGCVVDLVTACVGAGREVVADGGCQEVLWFSGSGPGRKRIRLNRKTPAHLAGFAVQSRPRVWKRLHHVVFSDVSIPDHKRRRRDQDDGEYIPTGVGQFPGCVLVHVSRLACSLISSLLRCMHEVM